MVGAAVETLLQFHDVQIVLHGQELGHCEDGGTVARGDVPLLLGHPVFPFFIVADPTVELARRLRSFPPDGHVTGHASEHAERLQLRSGGLRQLGFFLETLNAPPLGSLHLA